jgi:hypothetical protein
MKHAPNLLPTLLVFPAALWAQSSADRNPFDYGAVAVVERGFSGGQLLVAVAAGVVLAFCFQWLLTNLTAAFGISALQRLTDPVRRARARSKAAAKDAQADPDRAGRAYAERISGEKEEGWDDTATKLESGLGIWALLTSCLALFFACWLAVELIRIQNNLQGAILGLVIWGVFMGTMMRLEAAMASSLLGFVAAKARDGVGALFSPARAIAGSIAQARERSARREETVETAEEVAAAVRRELFPERDGAPEPAGIGTKIKDFVRANVKPKAMDAAHLGQEVKALLSDPEIIEMAKRGELMDLDRGRFAEIVAGRTDLDKEQVERMVETLHSTWSRFLGEHAPGRPGERAAVEPAGAKAPGQSVAAKYRQFKEFLRSTGREELRPERLEQEVKTLVLDPQAGITQLKEHFKELDRESLVQALGSRKDMTPEEANRIAEQIDLARSKVLSAREQAEHRAEELRDRILAKIRDHIYAAGRPELDYDGIEADFRLLFDDPKAGYAALKERLQGLDRESVIALLSTQEGVSREDAEKLVEKGEQAKAKAEELTGAAKAGIAKLADRILEAKEAVLERARLIEEETRRRLEAAKRVSLEQAESARKVASAAAWWMFAIGCASAVAAVLGGLAAAAT